MRIVLERCLQKDPENRLRDIGDVQLRVDGRLLAACIAGSDTADFVTTVGVSRSPWRRVALVLVSLLIGGLVTSIAMRRNAAERPAQMTALSIGARGEAALFVDGNAQELAITPDGTRIVYVGDRGRRIFVRALNQLEPVAIAAGTLLATPFVSPDGQWVGYGEGFGVLKKVPIAGGPAITITIPTGGFGLLRGAVWLADNTSCLAPTSVPRGCNACPQMQVRRKFSLLQTRTATSSTITGRKCSPTAVVCLHRPRPRSWRGEDCYLRPPDQSSTDLLTGGSNAVMSAVTICTSPVGRCGLSPSTPTGASSKAKPCSS